MTSSAVRVAPAEDPGRFAATDALVWFAEPSSAPAEAQLVGLPEDQRFAAGVEGADPATYTGIYGVYPMSLLVPGSGVAGVRPVPAAGLTWVGVHPDHRRTGVLTAMLRDHLERVHAQPGTHVSVLHASEPRIYGRYGYGLASLRLEVTLGRGTALVAPFLEDADRLTTRLATTADPTVANRLHECHRATAELGAVVGELGYYTRVCTALPEQQRGKEPMRVLFAGRDGADVGFALFRRTEKWERERPAGEMRVWAIQGEPAARLALLRRLVDFDLMGTVSVDTVGADDPLLRWIGGHRSAADIGTYDNLWVRLVDLPEALEARTWSAPCDVVVEVEDRFAPWNAGRWRIRADGATATVTRADTDPDLALSVDSLGAAYLGGGNLATLHRAGHVVERRPGAVRELWRAMRTEVAPTAAVMF